MPEFGAPIFNDWLRQTLRLRYQELEDQASSETQATHLLAGTIHVPDKGRIVESGAGRPRRSAPDSLLIRFAHFLA